MAGRAVVGSPRVSPTGRGIFVGCHRDALMALLEIHPRFVGVSHAAGLAKSYPRALVMKRKACSICRQMLPMTQYHRRRHTSRSGYRSACKDCTRAASQAARAARPPKPPDDEQRLKMKVRARTRAAVRRGLLRPLPCVICGAQAQAHHPDYHADDAHLHVVWLCPLHHAAEHGIRAWTKQIEMPFVRQSR
jgi:hypothetical protein